MSTNWELNTLSTFTEATTDDLEPILDPLIPFDDFLILLGLVPELGLNAVVDLAFTIDLDCDSLAICLSAA